jgi:hypothetical protein
MPPLRPVYYRSPDHTQPVPGFLETLNDATLWAIIDQRIERLATLTPDRPWLPEPHCERVSGELWELRCDVETRDGQAEYGILYGVHAIYALLLHAYAGCGRKRPNDARERAIKRWTTFSERAAGGDNSCFGDWAP